MPAHAYLRCSGGSRKAPNAHWQPQAVSLSCLGVWPIGCWSVSLGWIKGWSGFCPAFYLPSNRSATRANGRLVALLMVQHDFLRFPLPIATTEQTPRTLCS